MPVHARLQHGQERQVGGSHGGTSVNPAKNAVLMVNAPLRAGSLPPGGLRNIAKRC
jgi:hypothetical protein